MVDRVRVTERQDLSLVSILAHRAASASAINEAIGIDMPLGPTAMTEDAIVVIGSGPGIWLARSQGAEPGWPRDLERRLAGLAGVSDQTGAYRLFQIEGPDARTLVQRGAAIDLDVSAFPPGATAMTVIGHVDVIIRCLLDGRSYEVMVYRSYAESFLRWVDATAAGL